ncbi:hypothetical protein HYPSUDRAFT_210193 [Hypholoma sublateritium FD-334 SS-4]|uniref:Uncharacterized protein n=1 Tax=Hypholoma sublateritium (strain FD-334 SS-4) TaxID=945553 RepID=A0A0D2N7J2_HYPSF|nr:hypothetical protein HYPSUDRAFT_210193 [Hypholoma sublateritium FD-334 SS-4]
MIHCNRAMHFAALVLTFAPQSYMLTLLTVTLFQRAYLETLACYEYLTIWEERKNSLSLARRPVDTSIMGAFTCSPQVAEEFNQLGVPVWYLRHIGTLSRDMKVGSMVYPSIPEGAVKDIFYESERVCNLATLIKDMLLLLTQQFLRIRVLTQLNCPAR